MLSGITEKSAFLTIWLAAITLVLVTPALTGLFGLIALILVMLATGLYLTIRHGFAIWVGNRFALFLTVAFGLIALSFMLTAREPGDLLFLANFLGILIGPPMLFLSRRHAGVEWTKRIILMAACGAIIIFLVSVYDIVVQQDTRAHGFFIGGSNRLGQLGLFFGTISLGGMIVWRELRIRMFLVLAALLSSIAIVLSGSRGVAIAAVPTAVMAITFAVAGRMHGTRVAAVAVLVAVAFGLVIWASTIADGASSRIFTADTAIQQVMAEGYSEDSNIQIRLDLYQSAADSFLSSPLTGVGWKKALEVANERVSRDEYLPRPVRRRDYPHLHSDILGYAGSMGLLGLAAFALLVAAPWTGLQPKDELYRFRAYLLATMVGVFHVYALTDVSLLFDISIIAYVLVSALIVGTFRVPDDPKKTVQEAV